MTWSDYKTLGRFWCTDSFDAATDLANSNKYPVFFAMSCELGQSEVPDAAICRNLLLAPRRGVVGYVGPSRRSSEFSNYPFLDEAVNCLVRRGIRRMGDVTVAATLGLKEEYRGPTDIYHMLEVLGDPGLEIDFGTASRRQTEFLADMELSTAIPRQYQGGGTGNRGVQQARAGVVQRRIILGRRSYRVEGLFVASGPDPTGYWTLYRNLGMTLGPSTRFLTYWITAGDKCGDLGRAGVDLSADVAPGLRVLMGEHYGSAIKDQYGQQMAVAVRRVPPGTRQFYAFDLSSAYGATVQDVVVAQASHGAACTDSFSATYDDIALVPTWGSPPEVGPIEMATNMYKNTTHNASIGAYDLDVLTAGDALSVHWFATKGYFAPDTGFNVVYHAPNDTATGVVTAIVSDKGGHSDTSTKTIVVINYVPPTCPHLFVWDGREYLDQGAVLTRSRFDAGAVLRDARPVLTRPVPTGGMMRLALREEGNDSATLDRVAMTFMKVDSVPEGRIGIGPGGRVLKAVRPIAPIYCSDDHEFQQLDKVVARDSVLFSAFGPGYLYVGYKYLLPEGVPKLGRELADDGGGPDLEDPPKNQYKIAVPPPEPKDPNYVSVSVLTPNWEWQEVARLAPESKAGLPELIDLLPYVDAGGGLWIKIAWTWSFTADDLCFYRFTDSGIVERNVVLSGARHNTSGSVVSSLLNEDGQRATLSPGQEITFEFPATRNDLYDFTVMRFWGRYDPVNKGGQTYSGPTAPIPDEVHLAQNFPNPFNASTVITYDLPEDGHATLEVFDILGRHVVTLVNEDRIAGQHTVSWDGRDDRGNSVASGIYFYRLTAHGAAQSKKMILIK